MKIHNEKEYVLAAQKLEELLEWLENEIEDSPEFRARLKESEQLELALDRFEARFDYLPEDNS